MLETLKVTLDANTNITPEVKENLMELITVFANNEAFKDVDLSNLGERLKTLNIRRESKYLVRMPARYNAFNNEILINEEMISESDVRHWMMHALLGVITGNENRYGFTTTDNEIIAMTEGYTEILTNYLVGDIEDNYFTDEILVTNLLGKIIGEDNLFTAYFKNDSEAILSALREIDERLLQILGMMDENFEASKSNSRPSKVCSILLTFIEIKPELLKNYPEYFPTTEEDFPKEQAMDEASRLNLAGLVISEEDLNHSRPIESIDNAPVMQSVNTR